MRALTPEQLARQPDRLLGDPGSNPLRAALDACWTSLSERERETLSQLSVFRGGFDLDSATALVNVPGPGGVAIDDTLSALRDTSLLASTSPSGGAEHGALRFTMLELVREYAAARCPDLAAVRARHAAIMVARARTLVGELDRSGGVRARRAIAIERDNLLAIVDGADPTAAVEAASLLAWTGLAAGPFDEHAAILARALAGSGDEVAAAIRAEGWWLLEEMLRQAGRLDEAERAIVQLRRLLPALPD